VILSECVLVLGIAKHLMPEGSGRCSERHGYLWLPRRILRSDIIVFDRSGLFWSKIDDGGLSKILQESSSFFPFFLKLL